MSDHYQRNENQARSRKWESRWLALSIVVSLVILAWAALAPLQSATNDGGKSARALQRERRLAAEEFRLNAIAMDRDFMAERAERLRQQRNRPLPDNDDAREYWQQQVVAHPLSSDEVEPDSIEWVHQERMKRILEDAPK